MSSPTSISNPATYCTTATGRALHPSALSGFMLDLDIGAVPHGFRSSFRDWAAECTDAPREVYELALAQVNSDRVKAACRRTDLFDVMPISA